MTDTVQGVQNALNDLIAAMLGKGLISPNASMTIKGNEDSYIHLEWKKRQSKEYNPNDREYKFFHVSETLDAAFIDARSFIEAMQNKAERERQMFMDNLAETIEIGRRIGIEDGYVNPLLDMMKKLSENAISGPAA